MKKDKTFFSIVTPTLNSEKFIKKTVTSIHNQKFKNFEHTIVDGKSSDNTIKILRNLKKKYKFKLIIKKDNSMYEAIDRGFKKSKGKYLYWLNSDDFLCNNNVLSNLYQFLILKRYNWINGRTAILNQENGNMLKWLPLIYPKFVFNNRWNHKYGWGFVQQENVIFSKKLYKKVGGFDQKLKMAGDYDLWLKFSKYEKLEPINIEIAVHRKWKNQLTDLDKYYKEIKKKRGLFNLLYPIRILYSIFFYPFIKNRK